MAIPMTAPQMLTALMREGIEPLEYRSWRTHNRNHKGPWGPVHGVMIHHTVTKGDTYDQTSASVELCYEGHSALPGPLCHAVGAKSGDVYLVGNGRTNHAGKGDSRVLGAVIDEEPLPRPTVANKDGNQFFYGIELINLGDGKDSWPSAQYITAVGYAAAICRFHGWSERSVIGHKEWQPGKIDPTFDMDRFRSAVRAQLNPPPTMPPPVTSPMEPRMEYTALARTTSLTIPAGETRAVYWDVEIADGAGDHGTGGKTIVSGEHYTGTVSLWFNGPLPGGVSVRMNQELDAGGSSADPETGLVHSYVRYSVPVTGRVPESANLVFEILNDSEIPVSLTWAGVRLGTWAL